MLTQPGIPNAYALSTTCYGSRLKSIEDQAFAAVAMGFRRLELGLLDAPVKLNGFEDSRRETGIAVRSMIAGCLDPRSGCMSSTKLGSVDEDQRERALNSMRRHIRLAQQYACPVVVVRGCEVEDAELAAESEKHTARILRGGDEEALAEHAGRIVSEVQKRGQRQVEHLCRSLHTLRTELPDTTLAIEAGPSLLDLLNFESVGWVLDDLERHGVVYWHDAAGVQMRQRAGLQDQGAWLDRYARHMVGIHLHDTAEGLVEMPPGTGEVDFKLVASYVPREAEKVVQINPRHGRAQILSAVQFLVDTGF